MDDVSKEEPDPQMRKHQVGGSPPMNFIAGFLH
jgi:hypothetical protein